jgi:hypothetical protein
MTHKSKRNFIIVLITITISIVTILEEIYKQHRIKRRISINRNKNNTEEPKETVEQFLLNRFKYTVLSGKKNSLKSELKQFELTNKQINFLAKNEELIKQHIKSEGKLRRLIGSIGELSDSELIAWINMQ